MATIRKQFKPSTQLVSTAQVHAAPRLKFSSQTIIAHTQPGLEAVVISEAVSRIAGVTELGRRVVPDRSGLAVFDAPDPRLLARLRCAEDLFAMVGYARGIATDEHGLEAARRLARAAPFVEQALLSRVQVTAGSRAGYRLSFRVLVRVVGDHQFRRVDLARALERGIGERGDHRWRAQADGEVEFWATLLQDELILALRLSDDRMRQRQYKVAHFPGSLRPSVAAAMAWLSQPQDDDVVVDPLCGAGTILIERAHLGRYRMLLGGDHNEAVLAAARENIGPRYKPIELRLWDATALPLRDASVTRVIVNLPWGRRIGSHSDNRRLYPRLMGEFRRVLVPGGRLVMLSGEGGLLRESIARSDLTPSAVLPVTILGTPARIVVCAI
ncbi:MAG TPA: methyltransferase domain-containing protein [Candidatus Binataceae bacterium]|nr:methyltransferase domain-containing protein [Candidatus Binataceae bacterium]